MTGQMLGGTAFSSVVGNGAQNRSGQGDEGADREPGGKQPDERRERLPETHL
jgi:hypothetical protein